MLKDSIDIEGKWKDIYDSSVFCLQLTISISIKKNSSIKYRKRSFSSLSHSHNTHLMMLKLCISCRFDVFEFFSSSLFHSYLLFLTQSVYLPRPTYCRFCVNCCEFVLLFHHTFLMWTTVRFQEEEERRKKNSKYGRK